MPMHQRGYSWQADITVNGERIRETFGRKADAQALELEAKAAALWDDLIHAQRVTVEQLQLKSERFHVRGDAT